MPDLPHPRLSFPVLHAPVAGNRFLGAWVRSSGVGRSGCGEVIRDDPGHGFDNVTVGALSPTLLDRYLSAARKISRLAVGTPLRVPGGDTFQIRPDLTQDIHVEGLPLGTRAGVLIPYTFPRDGEYEIRIRLARNRNEEIEGLHEPHEVEVLLDRARVKRFTVAPPEGHKDFDVVDQPTPLGNLHLTLLDKAGVHLDSFADSDGKVDGLFEPVSV